MDLINSTARTMDSNTQLARIQAQIAEDRVKPKKETHICECMTKKGTQCKSRAIEEYNRKWLCYTHIKEAVQKDVLV